MDPFVVIPLNFKRPITFENLLCKRSRGKVTYIDEDFNGYSFDQLISCNEKYLTYSTVGYQGKDIIDQEVRRSQVIKDIKINIRFNSFYDQETDLNPLIKKVIPPHLRGYDFAQLLGGDLQMTDDEEKKLVSRKWDLIIYNPDDRFVRHVDGKATAYHHATLLLFPPAEINRFEGGELVFYQSGQALTTLYPNQFDCWTLVAFPINVEHACLPILSGKRYVFKSKLQLPRDYVDFCSLPQSNLPIQVTLGHIAPEIEAYRAKIAEYHKEVMQMQEKVDRMALFLLSQESHDIINQIQEKNEDEDQMSPTFMIVLDRYYEYLDPNYLIGEDCLLYNAMVSLYPRTKLAHMKNVTHNLGDGHSIFRPSNSLDLECDLTSQIQQIIYQKGKLSKGQTPGDIIETASRYNDSTYDKIVLTNITVMIGCRKK